MIGLPTHILLIEDDYTLVQIITALGGREGFSIHPVPNLKDAKTILHQHPYKLALVDLNLGDGDNGMEFVRFAREFFPNLGIIIISARTSPTDRIVGIEMGADDYLTKPLNLLELVARIRRLIKRLEKPRLARFKTRIRFNGFTLDRLARTLFWEYDEAVDLTSREFDTLSFIVDHLDHVVSRETITAVVCGRPWQSSDRSIDVTVSMLRKKLRGYNERDVIIKSIRGAGYCFVGRIEAIG